MKARSRFPTIIHNTLDLEGGAGELGRFRLHGGVDAHGGEGAADYAAGEVEKLRRRVSRI